MKLTPSIVEVMGGKNSKYFEMFLNQAQVIYNIMRDHSNEFACPCEPCA